MLTGDDSTTWIAVGASALALLSVAFAVILVFHLRRLRQILRDTERWPLQADLAVSDLTQTLERAQGEAARAQEESARARKESEQGRGELRWLGDLNAIGATLELERVLECGLELATRLADTAAAMVVLARDDEEPLVATFGLSADESSRDLLGFPPEGGHARAVTLTYRYTEREAEHDEFRLRGGIALPVVGKDEWRLGTLAVFWRRAEREVTESELARLEALTGALGHALENAFRFEDVHRLLDLDPLTGLFSGRRLDDALVRECSRARRYERRLSLILLELDARLSVDVLALVGERLRTALRSADIACHLEEGRFAVLAPESGFADAQRLYRRLQLAVGGNLPEAGRARVRVGIVELRPDDDSRSFFSRAEAALARDWPGEASEPVAKVAG
jgi:GGDEF domain-containing protein/Sec-independent protein translocase protein TatA